MPNKKSQYHQDVKIPVKANGGNSVPEKKNNQNYLKIVFFLVFAFVVITGQALLSKAYEAHVINVTAHICRQSETRTPGYWKTHPEVYEQYLPQYLGGCSEDKIIDSAEAADAIFQNANAKDMRRRLEAHLLAMKFNIVHYGVGEYEYYVESWGREVTIYEIVDWADMLLRDCDAKRKDLEEVKDILDYLNNLQQLRYCATITQASLQTFQSLEGEGVITERIAVPTCEAESQQPCFTSLLGICAEGIQTCDTEGNWGECIQSNLPINEICDNQLDDDCNGLTDCNDSFCALSESCNPLIPPVIPPELPPIETTTPAEDGLNI